MACLLARSALLATCTLLAAEAHAGDWELWADAGNGVPAASHPKLAISAEREIFISYLAPQMDATGVVYRASLDDPARQFTAMPDFPLPTPPMGMPYYNVFSMTTNARGEPVLGLSN